MPSTLFITKRDQLVVALLLSVVAALLRFHNLDGQSIWNDEMFSIEVGRLSFAEIQPSLIAHFHHPPLYFYLLHSVFVFMGENIWTLRFLSAVFGTLTIGVVCSMTAYRWGWKAGAVAGLLCCFSPFHLAYSQEGRPYALAALLALLSCHYFLRTLQEEKRGPMLGYVVSTIALLYTHHWGIFAVCIQGIILLAGRFFGGIAGRRHLIMLGLIVVLYLPEVPALTHQSGTSASGQWWWAKSPTAREVFNLSGAFSGTRFNFASAVFEASPLVQLCGAACILFLIGAGVYHILSRRNDVAFMYGTAFTAGILAIPFAISFLRPEVFLWYRYTVIAFPLACVLGGALFATRQWKWPVTISVAVLLAIGISGVGKYYSWSKANIKAVASYLSELTYDRPTLLIRPPYVSQMLNMYYSGSAVQLDEAYLNTPLGEIIDTARSFVYVSLDIPNPIREYMDGHFIKVSEMTFPGIAHMGLTVGVYNQKPDPDESEGREEER